MGFKRGLVLASLLFGFVYISGVLAVGYYDDYSDVLLVCNEDSSESQEICDYFVTQRSSLDFNTSHIVNLSGIDTTETINYTEYLEIVDQIQDFFDSNNDEINYIVTTKGVPLRTNNRSVDSMLVVAFSAESPGYYNVEDIFTHAKYGSYLVTRLTGVSVQDAKNLIDNARSASINGEFLLNNYSTTFGDYYTSEANSTLVDKGYSVEFNTTTFVMNRSNLSGYWSWGSNSGFDGSSNSSDWNLTFNPGALGETGVSTSARTFANLYDGTGPYGAQSLIADLIRTNITGVKGYVYEPYLGAIAKPHILFDRYTDGYNLADSYYMASLKRDWMDVVVGDPKTYSVANTTKPSITLESPFDGERIPNGTIVNLTVYTSSRFGSLDTVWYNIGGSNTTLADPYEINISDWGDYGDYNLTVYVNDSNDNVGSKIYSFIFNTTNGTTPTYYEFDGGNTSDFKAIENRQDVENATLEVDEAGQILFLENVNVSGLDINEIVEIGHNYAFVNLSSDTNLNKSANITFYNSPGEDFVEPVILREGVLCDSTTSPACYNFTALNDTTVIFNVSSWSEYEIGENGGTLNSSLVDVGSTTGEVYQNQFFNVTSEICCEVAECGDVEVSLAVNRTGDWNATIDYVYDSLAEAVVLRSNGSYVVGGAVSWKYGEDWDDSTLLEEDYLVAEFDSEGTEIWKTYFGGSADSMEFNDLVISSDGGFLGGGYNGSRATTAKDFSLVKMTSNGTHDWNVSYGGSSPDELISLKELDGGIILFGDTQSFGEGSNDIWMIKTNSTGSHLWNQTYGGSSGDFVNYGTNTSDGGYILIGHTASFGEGSSDAWVIKTDSLGNEEWNQTFGGSSGDIGYSLIENSDGSFVLLGTTYSFGEGNGDMWIMKINSTGGHEWNVTHGGSGDDGGRKIIKDVSGGYILTGTTKSYGGGTYSLAWVVKTNSTGGHVWNTTYYSDSRNIIVYDALQNEEGAIVLAGKHQVNTLPSYSDTLIIKTENPSTKGLVMNSTGVKNFYTSSENSQTINLNVSECENVTWSLNASGDVGVSNEFHVYANKTVYESISTSTDAWNLTITELTSETEEPVTSGGGGGGSTIDAGNLTGDYRTNLTTYQVLNFTFEGRVHEMRVIGINVANSVVDFEIDDFDIEFSLNENNETIIDLNKDGENDIKVRLNGIISGSEVDVTLSVLEKDSGEGSGGLTETITNFKNNHPYLFWILFGVGCLIALGVLGWIIYLVWRYKNYGY